MTVLENVLRELLVPANIIQGFTTMAKVGKHNVVIGNYIHPIFTEHWLFALLITVIKYIFI